MNYQINPPLTVNAAPRGAVVQAGFYEDAIPGSPSLESIQAFKASASQLQAAADAAATGHPDETVTAHQTARARLYDALWHAGLLTLDEELQELAADLPPKATREGTAMRAKTTDRLLQRTWHAWRSQKAS